MYCSYFDPRNVYGEILPRGLLKDFCGEVEQEIEGVKERGCWSVYFYGFGYEGLVRVLLS